MSDHPAPNFEPDGAVEDCRLFRWRSMLLAVHWHAFRIEHFDLIGEACERIRDDEGTMTSVVVTRGSFSFMLDAEGRQAGVDLTARCEPFNRGQAMIIDVIGFKGSLLRSMLAGVNLVARSKAPQKVFSQVGPAARWLCELEAQPGYVRDQAQSVAVTLEALVTSLPLVRPQRARADADGP